MAGGRSSRTNTVDRKSTRLNSSHRCTSYPAFFLTALCCAQRSTLFPYTALFRSEVEPQQARRRLRRIAHQVMVVGPHDGDEEVAHGVTQPRGPEAQERPEGGNGRRAQLQDQHGRSEEHTSELQSPMYLVSRLLLDSTMLRSEIDPLSLHGALPI